MHARAEGNEGGKGRTACPFHVSLEDLGRKAGERVAPSSEFELARSLGREGERKPVFCRLDFAGLTSMSVAADATTGNAQRALGAKTAGLRQRPACRPTGGRRLAGRGLGLIPCAVDWTHFAKGLASYC